MKRTLIILAIAAIAAPWSLVADEVLSRNAVGYVKVDAEANKFKMVGLQFDKLDGTDTTVGDLLGTTGIPDLTVVYMFNGTEYVGEQYYDGAGWWPGTNIFDRANGFWISCPSAHEFYMMGEVPGVDTSTVVSLDAGYQMVAFPYPTTRAITNTWLNDNAKDLDSIYVYDGTNYVGYQFYAGVGWWPDDLVLEPGQAFWYSTTSATNWVASKPYTWP